jgi:hypothetical protein
MAPAKPLPMLACGWGRAGRAKSQYRGHIERVAGTCRLAENKNANARVGGNVHKLSRNEMSGGKGGAWQNTSVNRHERGETPSCLPTKEPRPCGHAPTGNTASSLTLHSFTTLFPTFPPLATFHPALSKCPIIALPILRAARSVAPSWRTWRSRVASEARERELGRANGRWDGDEVGEVDGGGEWEMTWTLSSWRAQGGGQLCDSGWV